MQCDADSPAANESAAGQSWRNVLPHAVGSDVGEMKRDVAIPENRSPVLTLNVVC